jgi:hypothetical protein
MYIIRAKKTGLAPREAEKRGRRRIWYLFFLQFVMQ